MPVLASLDEVATTELTDGQGFEVRVKRYKTEANFFRIDFHSASGRCYKTIVKMTVDQTVMDIRKVAELRLGEFGFERIWPWRTERLWYTAYFNRFDEPKDQL